MKTITTLSLAFCLLFFCCRPKDKPADDPTTPQVERAILENPSSWIKLSEVNGKQVIFQPCDANNLEIKINKDTLYINLGQEEAFYSIVRFDETDTTTVVTVKEDGGSTEQKFPVMLDGKGRIARWSIRQEEPAEMFVNAEFANEYPTVKQPCRECWEKDVCDEQQKADSVRNGSSQ